MRWMFEQGGSLAKRDARPVAPGPLLVAWTGILLLGLLPSIGCKKAPPPAADATTGRPPAAAAPQGRKPVAVAATETRSPTAHAEENPTPDHRAFDELLSSWVTDGRVAYRGWKANAKARAKLAGYLGRLGKADLSRIRGSDAELTFWLNAYNACVIQAVLDRWPIASVKKVPGFFKKRRFLLAGRRLTLDEIENRLIRPRFREARVHFALVCAAASCPPLPSRAFFSKDLRARLENLTRNFLQGPPGVEVVSPGKRINISRLFEWYRADFVAAAGSVWGFLRRYRKDLAKHPRPKIGFLEYDWSLNSR